MKIYIYIYYYNIIVKWKTELNFVKDQNTVFIVK